MTVGIQREGAHRTHLVGPSVWTERNGQPYLTPGRAICGTRISWLVVSDEDCSASCQRCWQALFDAIPSPTGGPSSAE